ncbi:MAG: Lrp/AsnC family transcriptional regulator [Balneola sp.]
MEEIKLDEFDKKIIRILQKEGRLSNKELSERINLTTTPTLERVRRLEKQKVIEGYSAIVNKESIGKGFSAFVSVTLSIHQLNLLDEFTSAIKSIPEILACYNTTGEGDFLLYIVARDVKDFEQLLRSKLANLPDVQRLRTSIVLSTIKEESNIPI